MRGDENSSRTLAAHCGTLVETSEQADGEARRTPGPPGSLPGNLAASLGHLSTAGPTATAHLCFLVDLFCLSGPTLYSSPFGPSCLRCCIRTISPNHARPPGLARGL